MPNPRVATVVVTYNRLALLKRCLEAINAQSFKPCSILIVDNGSTDGTSEWLKQAALSQPPIMQALILQDNLGGAGGFAEGIHSAIAKGAEWVWLMDDDAEPHPNALATLMAAAPDPINVYGSLAVQGEYTSWPATLPENGGRKTTHMAKDVPALAEIESLPFLGFLINRSLVEKIGLPDAGFFIAADDIEYCLRAKRAGARILVAGRSLIEHPKADWSTIKLGSKSIVYLRLSPWKRYYDTRNRLLVARKYYGTRILTETVPGTFARLGIALQREPDKLRQLWAFIAGMTDGLLGLKGRRHGKWGISQ